jgi:hypothetical protein
MNVFKEAQKAETKLKNLDKREDAAIEKVQQGYAGRRQAIIAGLDIQVRAALRTAGILEREPAQSADEDETVDVDMVVEES